MQPILLYHSIHPLPRAQMKFAAQVYALTEIMRKPITEAAAILDAKEEDIADYRYRMALDFRDGKKAWEVMQSSPKSLFFLHDDGTLSDETGQKFELTIH